jgi:hypothetical protein
MFPTPCTVVSTRIRSDRIKNLFPNSEYILNFEISTSEIWDDSLRNITDSPKTMRVVAEKATHFLYDNRFLPLMCLMK